MIFKECANYITITFALKIVIIMDFAITEYVIVIRIWMDHFVSAIINIIKTQLIKRIIAFLNVLFHVWLVQIMLIIVNLVLKDMNFKMENALKIAKWIVKVVNQIQNAFNVK